MMHVGFVPAFKRTVALDDGMFGLAQLRAEHPRSMLLKLCPHQFNVLGRIQEAVRSTVQRNKAFAPRHIVQERLFLFGGNLGCVGVDQQSVVLAERLQVKIGRGVGVGQFNAPLRQYGRQFGEPFSGPMMAVVAQEQNSNGRRLVSQERRRRKAKGKQSEQCAH